MLVFENGKLTRSPTPKPPRQAFRGTSTDVNLMPYLLEYMAKNKLSDASASRLIGVTPATFCQWKLHNRKPLRIYAERIIKLLRSDLLNYKIPKTEKYNDKKINDFLSKLEKSQPIDKPDVSQGDLT